jgi:hypothetical protein
MGGEELSSQVLVCPATAFESYRYGSFLPVPPRRPARPGRLAGLCRPPSLGGNLKRGNTGCHGASPAQPSWWRGPAPVASPAPVSRRPSITHSCSHARRQLPTSRDKIQRRGRMSRLVPRHYVPGSHRVCARHSGILNHQHRRQHVPREGERRSGQQACIARRRRRQTVRSRGRHPSIWGSRCPPRGVNCVRAWGCRQHYWLLLLLLLLQLLLMLRRRRYRRARTR